VQPHREWWDIEYSSLAELTSRRLVGIHDEPGRRIDLQLGDGSIATVSPATDLELVPPDVLGDGWANAAGG